MKKYLMHGLCLLTLATIIAASCKSRSSDLQKSLAVIDSLNITDPEEIKVSTEYVSLIQEVLEAGQNHPANVTDQYKADFLNKYGDRINAVNLKMQSLIEKVNDQDKNKLKNLITIETNKFDSIK